MKVSLYNKVAVGALALVGVGAVSSGAWAYTADFAELEGDIDGTGVSSATLYGAGGSDVDVTLNASPDGAVLTWDDSDAGVGIAWSYEDDEIEADERLTITFSQEVELSDVYLVDLFNEAKNNAPGTYLEDGYYQVDGGSWVGFSADPSQTSSTDGYLDLPVNAMVTTIAFKAPGYTDYTWWSGPKEDNEFAVKSLSFSVPTSSVPELDGRAAFGAVGLLFGGLMAGTSRRRKLCAKSGA
jgi:hypothetical protein